MSNITDLQAKINAYNTAFAEYFKSPDLLATLIKTFTSHNITIEDWNTVVQTVKDNLELTPDIKEILNNVEACLEELYEDVLDIQNKVTKTSTPNIVYGTDSSGNPINYAIESFSSEYRQPKIPTIIVTQSMITGAGTGAAPYWNEWYRFNFGANNQYLVDDTYDTIKLDITAIRTLLDIPTNYLYLKRNATNSDQGITLYQFYIADTGFDYAHIQDLDPYIQIAQIGDAALIYEPTSGAGWLTNRNINPTDIYSRIGELEDGAEMKANKVTSVSNTSTDTEYPSAKCLYDNLQNVREVAEGKCQTFVLSYNDTTIASPDSFYDIEGNLHPYSEFSDFVSGYSAGNSLFNSQNASISPIGTIGGYLGTKYYFIFKSIAGSTWHLSGSLIVVRSDEMFNVAKTGDIFLVVETDVPDRWFGSTNASTVAAYKLETAKVDLTNYPTKSGDETISGNWTFSSYISFNTGGSGETTWSIRKGSNQLEIYNGPTQTYVWQGSAFFSMIEGDLGTSSRKWGNLFLKQDGRIKVNGDNDALRFYQGLTYFYGDFKPIGNDQDIGDDTHKVDNAWIQTLKGIVTLTQAEYDALVSGGTVDADTLYFIEEE